MKDTFILMADIISSRNKEGNAVMKEFKSIVKHINTKYETEFLSPATITLGDEFQAVVKTLKGAIYIILAIEELTITNNLNFKLRYVVEYGKIETKINNRIAYEMLGPGLTSAREHLEKTKTHTDRRVSFYLAQQLLAENLNNLFFVHIAQIDRWKKNDYALIKQFLIYVAYNKVAIKLKKDRSQIWRKEKTLMMREYFALKESIKYTAEYATA